MAISMAMAMAMLAAGRQWQRGSSLPSVRREVSPAI